MHNGLASFSEVETEIKSGRRVERIAFDTRELSGWDSSLITFLKELIDYCGRSSITPDPQGLPEGIRRLLELATAVPEKEARRAFEREPWLFLLGKHTLETIQGATAMAAFLGEAVLAFVSLLRGRARFRRDDLVLTIRQCGAESLPIVALISFLVGLILAYIGAVQLRQFGAQIYVADLVGLGMAREMGAMMTAIIIAGRIGAAFAAQLGTMRVNQEIDALTTMGISPIEFLVLPRMLALVLMTPLLCLYANLLGILGGAFVGITVLDLGALEYFNETKQALRLTDFATGLFKSAVYGMLVAMAGCLRGMQSGANAAAVGAAATSAVVTGIVFIVVSSATLTIIYDVLGI